MKKKKRELLASLKSNKNHSNLAAKDKIMVSISIGQHLLMALMLLVMQHKVTYLEVE
jgi:hypothetical protein